MVKGIGDDCAQLAVQSGRSLISTDILVENVHFIYEWTSAANIAQRAFAQNLADISASGGYGTGAVVSLVLPKRFTADERISFSLEFAEALAGIAKQNNVAIIGGDLSSGNEMVVNITVFGELEAGAKQICRDGAKAGDVVALAGEQGYSLTGYEFFAALRSEEAYSTEFIEKCKARYLVPSPPYQAGVKAAMTGATAMLDISDGLLMDCSRIARVSGVDIRLYAMQSVQNSKQFIELAELDAQIPLENYYFGGEDHCLLATFPKNAKIPAQFTVIGECVANLGANHSTYFTKGIILDDMPALQKIMDAVPENRRPKMWDHLG